MQFNNIPTNFPTIIIRDFNVNTLTQPFELTTLQTFMEQYHLKFILFESTAIYDIHFDHMWTNAPRQPSCFGSTTQAYWINHRLVYFALNLPNFIPQFVHHQF